MTGKEYPWILVITMTKKEGPSVSIATSIVIWQKNAKRRKRRTQGSALNTKEWVILQRIAMRNSR